MQLIFAVPISAEEYVSQNFQQTIRPPVSCPHCNASESFDVLGYYRRYVTNGKSGTLYPFIRRFRCRACCKTVSILPSFAQPYRLVHNNTVNSFFCGRVKGEDVTSWLLLLKRYWKRFTRWLLEIDEILRSGLDRAPPQCSAAEWWATIMEQFGNLKNATMFFVANFHVTLFGRYRCHCPNKPEEAGELARKQ